MREMFQEAASFPLADWFEFTIGPPALDLGAAPYGGARYPVEAWMDGRIFARFHLDAGIGDVVIQPVEIIECRDWLAFAGIASPWCGRFLESSSSQRNSTPIRYRGARQTAE